MNKEVYLTCFEIGKRNYSKKTKRLSKRRPPRSRTKMNINLSRIKMLKAATLTNTSWGLRPVNQKTMNYKTSPRSHKFERRKQHHFGSTSRPKRKKASNDSRQP